MSYPKCNKCNPEPCKCHPCYNTVIDPCKGVGSNCNTTTTAPVNICYQPPCEEGCEEFPDPNCIFINGISLIDYLEQLQTQIAECCQNTSPSTPNLYYSYSCEAGALAVIGNQYEGNTITSVNIYSDVNNPPLTFPITSGSNLIPYIHPRDSGVLVVSFISGTSTVLDGVAVIDCNTDRDQCLDPIGFPSFTYNCTNSQVSNLSSSVAYITINGVDYFEGDIVTPALLDNSSQEVTYVPIDGECLPVTVTGTISCLCRLPIINPVISYNCANGEILFSSDTVNSGIAITTVDLSFTDGTVITGITSGTTGIVLAPGLWTVTFNVADTYCPVIKGSLIVDCPTNCTFPTWEFSSFESNVIVKAGICTADFSVLLSYIDILGGITFQLHQGVSNALSPPDFTDTADVVLTEIIYPGSQTGQEVFTVSIPCTNEPYYLTWGALIDPTTGLPSCTGGTRSLIPDCSVCT